MLILFCFVIQAVAYEFRSKPSNVLGTKTFEIFLFINGALGTILLGAAVGTFYTGSLFSVSNMNLSRWEISSHGLEAALNVYNLLLGLTVFFLARVLGLLYFMNNVKNDQVLERSKRHLIYNAIPFVVLFLAFVITLFLHDGFGYDAKTKIVSMVHHKYLLNFVQMPLTGVLFLVGVLLVLYGILISLLKKTTFGIWFSGIGTVLTVFSLLLIAGLNHTAYYPSTFNLQHSLTIENSSSSHYTLTAMSYVSLLVPFVLIYIIYAWNAINKKPISLEEVKEESHLY